MPKLKKSKITRKKTRKGTNNTLVRFFVILFLFGLVALTIFLLQSTNKSFYAVYDPNYFPYGMFEDANATNGTTAWQSMITSLKSHNLDTVLFTNNVNSRDASTLSVFDSNNFNVIYAPMGDLNNNWWPDNISSDITTARTNLYPIVDAVKSHPSVKGYNINDDTVSALSQKVNLAVQAFHERDSNRPVMPVVVGNNESVYTVGRPDIFLTYSYPVGAGSQACNFYSTDYNAYGANDYVQYLQQTTREKDPSAPLWLILQAHGGGTSGLRTPSVTEARLQYWLSLGEGAKGIFWFIYSTQQFWTGLKDNPTLYSEVSNLGARIIPLKSVLLTLQKQDDLFTISNTNALALEHKAYISTLATADKSKYYIIIANRDCATQAVSISSSSYQGQVKDIETSTTYALNTPINLNPGDGKILEVLGTPTVPTQLPPVNLITNPSFETSSNGHPTSWGADPSSSYDSTVAHNGTASMKLTGPASFTYSNQTITLKPNTLYTYNYWVKTQNVNGDGVSSRYVELAPRTAIMPVSEWVKGTTDGWKRVSKSFFTPLDYQGGRFDILWQLNSGDVAWIDDMELCEGKQCYYVSPIPATATPTLGPTATPTNTPIPTATPTITPTPVVSQGLVGQYFTNNNLVGNPFANRTDSVINFNWGSGIPMTGVTSDNFSIRWTGFVTPQYSQTYSFYVKADDGVRLWVNNVQIINKWVSLGGGETKGTTVNLSAGVKYPIKLEYFEKTANAIVQLSWSSTSQPKQIIPTTRLSTN